MRDIFRSFASGSIGPKSGSQRPGLGMPDVIRFANAAQINLPREVLQETFNLVVQQGLREQLLDPIQAGADPALSFELFVELLVGVARKKYDHFSDAEGVALLFEENLLPLAWNIQHRGQRASY